MKKLIGPHLAGQWANKLEILRKWQPSLALVLSPQVDKVQQLREACPNTIVVGRFFHDDSHYASNINARPKEFAHEIHQEIVSNPVTPLLDYVQSNNETNQDWQGIQQLDVYTQEWMHLADQSQAYKCAILAFSVGNPDLPNKPGDPAGFDGKMLYWQQVLPSLNYAQQKNHILLMHAYGYPTMFQPVAGWYIYRYERQVQANLRTLGITNLKYAYGEIGIDRLIVNGKGGYKVVPTTDEGYVNQHLQWERDQQGEDLLLGGAIFTLGDSGGWDTYDIASTNVASMIAEHYVEHAGDYNADSANHDDDIFIPTVSTGTKPQEPALPPRDVDPRAIERGVTIETPPLKPGESYWRVVKVQWYDEQEADKLGPDHHIMADALDSDGKRMTGVPLKVLWPDGSTVIRVEEKPGEPYGANYPMSPSRNEFSIFVNNHVVPVEVVKGIGMGADTPSGFNAGIHTSTGVVFQWATVPAVTQSPPSTQPAPSPAPSTPQEPPMQPGIIDPRVAQAILAIESGGRTHGENGEPLIRFEAHIFQGKAGNTGHFRYNEQKPWTDQQWRKSEGDPWRNVHTGKQEDEYAAFEFAKSINREAAYNAISMGAPQIMGFNHARVGFPSAEAMFNAFQSAQVQTIAFINYFLSDPALVQAMQRKDWRTVALKYNGSGQVDHYAALLADAYGDLSA